MMAADRFIERSVGIHGDRYDYSLVEYRDSFTKAKIICKKHGVFIQSPIHHIQGSGCKKCAIERNPKNRPKSTEQFIKESTQIHGKKYDYSLVNYKTNDTKVTIICSIHGRFLQVPNSHLKGAGCKRCAIIEYLRRECKISNPEKKFGELLTELGIEYEPSFPIGNKIYDFHIPSKNLLIEIDGIYWHGKGLSDNELNEIQSHNRKNDDIKNRLAQENGYTIRRIWEDEITETACIRIFS